MGKQVSRRRRGETITETLAAILIVTLSTLVLVTLALTAVRFNRTAAEADQRLQAEQVAAENHADGAPGTVTLRGDHIDCTYNVSYTGGDGALTSYEKEKTP